MDLGAFSVSLSVKDLATSRAFYEKLGFSVFRDASEMKYLIMQNDSCTIGLFQGMLEGNIILLDQHVPRPAG
jgi:predicted lactoylglutathione lyase